jgi:hypothetical protein
MRAIEVMALALRRMGVEAGKEIKRRGRNAMASWVVLVSVVQKVNYMASIDDTPLGSNVSCYWHAYLISSDTAPSGRTPHAWLEFDVDSVERATAELESMGYRMLIKNKKEPWGQTVSRFLDSDGLLVGLTFTPSMR